MMGQPSSKRRAIVPATIVAIFAASWLVPAAPARNDARAGQAPSGQETKVWTNDDLRSLANTPLSFDSDIRADAVAPAATREPGKKPLLPREKDPAWYRVKLASLDAQIAGIQAKERRIQDVLKKGHGGSNALNVVVDPEGLNPEGSLQALAQERQTVMKKIDALHDLARRNGILPGELRREATASDYSVSDYEQFAVRSAPPEEPPQTEAQWRARFAALRRKLEWAERELEVLRREWGSSLLQYYNDPLKIEKEQYTRREINELRARIAEKKAEIASLKQRISDLEDDLRHAGGPPGWSR